MIVECLTPDFNAVRPFVHKVLAARPSVFAHNLETVERLSPRVRDRRSAYKRSLAVLAMAKEHKSAPLTKSSIMLGLGEWDEEIHQSLRDLKDVGCDVVTFGQYLAPTERHKRFLPIVEYVHPQKFKHWERVALEMKFAYVASGPLVRSSYRAGEYFIKNIIKQNNRAASGDS